MKEAQDALQRSDVIRFGHLMYLSHDSLDCDYEVSCKELNLMVDLARNAEGVYGARMTGGGFGGCTINLVDREGVTEFQPRVAHKYEEATRLSPQIFVSQPAEGASELPL